MVTFTLVVDPPVPGRAWLRTDLGRADVGRREIMDRVERADIKHNDAWHDIPMSSEEASVFSLILPLVEIGHFQAKCCFVPEGGNEPTWPEGKNSVVNVEPAAFCCAPILYNAFVRQFGPSMHRRNTGDGPMPEAVAQLESQGYTVIPPSGKFRDLITQIPFIMGHLGCRCLHLLPIHPTPTTYARMGRFGSPYAALDFFGVDPALAVFDPAATPLEQFQELVHAVHRHQGHVILDIAINHTGWAAAIHDQHPEWLSRDETGTIEQPGAWGVTWEDLTRLDYDNTDLWRYMAGMFLTWCRRGVDGFRCDAGYMIPVRAWQYIIARVRTDYPDTLFFLEGLGGKISVTCDLLNRAGMNWAYSELFQNYSRHQIETHISGCLDISRQYGTLIHFAETHDNNRLAAVSHRFAAMRTALCALLSLRGGFGFANGVEWFATEKIDVHQATGLNWGAHENQVDAMRHLNAVLAVHPVFMPGAELTFLDTRDDRLLAVCRRHEAQGSRLLVLVNLDCDGSHPVAWPKDAFSSGSKGLVDLMSKQNVDPLTECGGLLSVTLMPGQVMALTPEPGDLKKVNAHMDAGFPLPARVREQQLRHRVLDVVVHYQGMRAVSGLDTDCLSQLLEQDPMAFFRRVSPDGCQPRVIPWDWDRDRHRTVMIPPGFCLMVSAPALFRAEIRTGSDPSGTPGSDTSPAVLDRQTGLDIPDGRYRAILINRQPPVKGRHLPAELILHHYPEDRTETAASRLLFLSDPRYLELPALLGRDDILERPGLKLLGTTRKGAMMRAPAWWGRLESRYDALLAANLNPDVPENRWVMLSRYRIWAVFQGYSRELSLDCLTAFTYTYDNRGTWQFRLPTSDGRHYRITLELMLHPRENQVTLKAKRQLQEADPLDLPPEVPITLIIRPDVEDRGFHETVKAWTGPEQHWPAAVSEVPGGFVFGDDPARRLTILCSHGHFNRDDQWQYMVHRPMEAGRGLDPDSDLFSPGYFKSCLPAGETLVLQARVAPDTAGFGSGSGTEIEKTPSSPGKGATSDISGTRASDGSSQDRSDSPAVHLEADMALSGISEIGFPDAPASWPLVQAAVRATDAFVVEREGEFSVVAGYPWFLDWGRDSLIVCRGLVAAGRLEQAEGIVRLFAGFEDKGTLPNMIDGHQPANRETSDAPLWLFAAVHDLVRSAGDEVLDRPLKERTLRQILVSIARWIIRGTPGDVIMDRDTALVYSPSHYTWMDTNYPAGTPRQGYPVEIQALWIHALEFLCWADREHQKEWGDLAGTATASLDRLFFRPDRGYYADCRHSDGPVGAENAVADDALRPNQLLVVTLDAFKEKTHARQAVETCLELLVPGGIRSLAHRPVAHPLPVFRDGQCFNDPHNPYWGRYEGDEDTRRKPAYHNGTAWTWPFPQFCEAWVQVFGAEGIPAALAWLGSAADLMVSGCAGFLPEILDGDTPHTPRGCDAQAWGSSELARVWLKLNSVSKKARKS